MIIVTTNQHQLHTKEFVDPIKRIIQPTQMIPLQQMTKEIANQAQAIVITGTALQDNEYRHANTTWIRETSIPLLGICAGMHLLAQSYGAQLQQQPEIGMIRLEARPGTTFPVPEQAYALHNFTPIVPEQFVVQATNKENNSPQIIQHKNKLHIGIQFHPEVRNTHILEWFKEVSTRQ